MYYNHCTALSTC